MTSDKLTVLRTLADLQNTIDTDLFRLQDLEQEHLSVSFRLSLVEQLKNEAGTADEQQAWDFELSLLSCREEKCLQEAELLRDTIKRNEILFSLASQKDQY